MKRQNTPPVPFAGFPDFRANVTFTPLQFFTVVVPNRSRGCVRIVGYALRKVLGWVDAHGNPTHERLRLSYRELHQAAGVSRYSVAKALREAVNHHCLRRVESPRRARKGRSPRSGAYELCWDEEGPYTDSPKEFRGFYYPEAVLLPETEPGQPIRRPKAARKNIPNAFFDHLLPRERLSIIRVVAALLFYSIEWGKGGERKRPVRRSITELSNLADMSRAHVHAAVADARDRGYLVVAEEGHFTPWAGHPCRTATYAIRWSHDPGHLEAATSAPAPRPRPGRRAELPEKDNGGAGRKGDTERAGKANGDHTGKENGEHTGKVNSISIKKDLKTLKTTAAAPEALLDTPIAAAVALLVQAGFDTPAAHRLAQGRPLELIQNQLEWLPLRSPSRNRLGLLRRAIEGNWPKPEQAGDLDPAQREARAFASHYYAAYHRLKGPAGTEPFPKDLQAAAGFLKRVQRLASGSAADWGRQFGDSMREKHAGDPRAKPNLSLALVPYGDAFLRGLQRQHAAQRRAADEAARAAHETAFSARWQNYLRSAEADLQASHPDLYATFRQDRDRVRQSMSGGLFTARPEILASFDGEAARLADFASFFHHHSQCPVLDFWQWDQQLNPDKFETKTMPATDGSISEGTP